MTRRAEPGLALLPQPLQLPRDVLHGAARDRSADRLGLARRAAGRRRDGVRAARAARRRRSQVKVDGRTGRGVILRPAAEGGRMNPSGRRRRPDHRHAAGAREGAALPLHACTSCSAGRCAGAGDLPRARRGDARRAGSTPPTASRGSRSAARRVPAAARVGHAVGAARRHRRRRSARSVPIEVFYTRARPAGRRGAVPQGGTQAHRHDRRARWPTSPRSAGLAGDRTARATRRASGARSGRSSSSSCGGPTRSCSRASRAG